MKEEIKEVTTEREVHNFIKKYKMMPMDMIKELQAKLDIVNHENQLRGKGGIHIISTY